MGSNHEENLDEQEKLLIKEKQKKERSTSMSMKTRKIGRRLSRSMSIVALKIPEKANNILPRRLSKTIKHGDRSKKERTFDLAVIAPDKTQRQLTVRSSQKIHDVVSAILHEFGLRLPQTNEPPDCKPPPQGYAMLSLGDSKAPVDPSISSGLLEGEILVVDVQPEVWNGVDLDCFLQWERLFASTLFSAIELYGKPLLKAEIVSQEEYHLLFYYLQCVSEASNTLIERMGHYMEAGLLKNLPIQVAVEKRKDTEDKSILSELVQEGLLTKRDVELAGDGKAIQFHQWRNSADSPSNKSNNGYDTDLSSNRSSSSIPKIVLFSPDLEGRENREDEDKPLELSKQCCDDHRIFTEVNDHLWANVRWDFIEENNVKQYLTTSIQDLNSNYDRVRSVKRSCSESTLGQNKYEDGIYESLENIKSSQHDSTMTTPYESIEDLYDCIKKKSQYNSNEDDYHHNQDSSKEKSVSECTSAVGISSNFYENIRIVRECSVVSTKAESCVSFVSSNTSCSKICDTSSESTNEVSSVDYVSSFLRCRRVSTSENYDKKQSENERENEILLKQLFHGDLMDVYNDYITSYRYARGLLRTKVKNDEHFLALIDIRKGAAKYTIADYLELPSERRVSLTLWIYRSARVDRSGAGLAHRDIDSRTPVFTAVCVPDPISGCNK